MTAQHTMRAADQPTKIKLLIGAKSLAAMFNISVRSMFNILETSKFPAFKLGGRWCAREEAVLEWMTTEEGKRLGRQKAKPKTDRPSTSRESLPPSDDEGQRPTAIPNPER